MYKKGGPVKKKMKKKQEDLKKRENPMNKIDFESLYKELEEWTYNEKLKIKDNKNLTKEETLNSFKQLLEKEIKLLQKIDELKLKANKENKKREREIKKAAKMKKLA